MIDQLDRTLETSFLLLMCIMIIDQNSIICIDLYDANCVLLKSALLRIYVTQKRGKIFFFNICITRFY
jgi:hypothetical protein